MFELASAASTLSVLIQWPVFALQLESLDCCIDWELNFLSTCLSPTIPNSAYNEVTFNEKLAITKENLCTKYTPFTYKDITLNEKLPITKQNLCIFFFVIGRFECTSLIIFSRSSNLIYIWQFYLYVLIFLYTHIFVQLLTDYMFLVQLNCFLWHARLLLLS